jgi:nucleoside-diphosphate-sugar epimerase
MMVILGGEGRLGRALAAAYPAVLRLPRAAYADWWQAGSADEVTRFLTPYADQSPTVMVAAGLLDPRLGADELARVNVALPSNVIEGAARLGIKVITFGTVMETLLARQNAYVQSKTALGDHVAAEAARGKSALHIRLHTLYGGGPPSPFMFLGQVLDALQHRTPFAMTQGRQLREYHHVDDDAAAIKLLAAADLHGVVDLSHGAPVSLRALATHLFNAFDAPQLLGVGQLPEPAEENFSTHFKPHPLLTPSLFRDSLHGAATYLMQFTNTAGAGQ